MPKQTKGRKVKLMKHETELLADGKLVEITHESSTSRWLRAESLSADDYPDGYTTVYRPMGDLEVKYLIENGTLPDTQPYQAIIEGPVVGRAYAEKYLKGMKKVDTAPTTVVEFCIPSTLVEELMAIQHKVEDGAISMGLGDKAGGGLPLFNAALRTPPSSFRLVLVKRRPTK